MGHTVAWIPGMAWDSKLYIKNNPPSKPDGIERLMAIAGCLHRAYQSWESSASTQRFWATRLYEVAAELGIPAEEIAERWEAYVATRYWSDPLLWCFDECNWY